MKIRIPELNENALTVLNKRYLWRNESGEPLETPLGLFERVAHGAAALEKKHQKQWREEFLEMMVNLRFLPNSPTLMNMGRKEGQLSACFVLPVEDSLDGIFDSLKSAAKIHQSGGGTGFSFSRLRPKGSIVRSTSGVASGPVSFMKIYDTATDTIKQGGARRGANMGILRVDHPDIFEFIESKRDQKSALNFNISVGITNDFMRAVSSRGQFELRDPKTQKVTRTILAAELFELITQVAWECGDPGMVFLDRINLFNPTPNQGEMESTNPCGEQPLLPIESCNLGSLNLGEFYRDGAFDWDLFRKDIHKAVRFLDNVIDLNAYPIISSRKITLKNRKIGLGVMGFADLLLYMGLPYSDEKAVNLGEKIMSFLDREAKQESMRLAVQRGPFPNWKGSMWERLGYAPLRNATVSTVAPTGTISIIAGASSGIEPIFSAVFYRNVLSGARLMDVHPSVRRVMTEKGAQWNEQDDLTVSKILGSAWTPAAHLSVESHVRMQAAFQRHSDSAVSKTINLPESASRDQVAAAYQIAYESGCKGITVYRDKSRKLQVLEAAEPIVCVDCD